MRSTGTQVRKQSQRRLVFMICLSVVLGIRSFEQMALAQVSSREASGLTLSQATEIAMQTNPLTRVTAAGSELADAQLAEARSGRWPMVVANTNFTRSNNPVFVFGSLLEQGSFGPGNFEINSLNHPDALNNFRSSLTLRLPLFDQRQTTTRIATAKIGLQQADHQANLVRQQIRFEVIKSYYGLLLAQAQLGVANEAILTADADVKRARDMFDSGVVVQSDLLAAQVQLAEFRQQRVQVNSELVTARAALNTALGLPVETLHQPLSQLAEQNFSLDPVEVLFTVALQNRPDYQQAALASRSRSAELRGARGEWLPRVDAFVTAGHSSSHLIGGGGDYAVGSSVTFNVFDAGRKGRISQAHAAESIANAQQEQLANQIRFEVVRAYQQYLSARERLRVVAEVSAQASETLRIVQDRYEAGITTITELLRAETALVRARSDVLAARYDQYVGYANVLLATGRLTDVDVFGS